MTTARSVDDRINPITSIPFFGIHVAAFVGVFVVDFHPSLIVWAVLGYVVRIWAVTAGYHRYFSHRSFETSRLFQFLLALLGTLAMQKGPLWWAAHHRWHHQHADTDVDIHSPNLKGLFWAHMGWILCDKYKETELERVSDFARFPELVWLDKGALVPPTIMLAALYVFGGPGVFVWGGLLATVLSWHGLFCANSLTHLYGTKRFPTIENSRNNALFGLLVLGEGWHNNHHYYPGAARQGFVWWEIDLTYYGIKLLEAVGILRDVRGVPERVMAAAITPSQ
jgi:stearoyl-CoA desaturase (delta-9 desaturase)